MYALIILLPLPGSTSHSPRARLPAPMSPIAHYFDLRPKGQISNTRVTLSGQEDWKSCVPNPGPGDGRARPLPGRPRRARRLAHRREGASTTLLREKDLPELAGVGQEGAGASEQVVPPHPAEPIVRRDLIRVPDAHAVVVPGHQGRDIVLAE